MSYDCIGPEFQVRMRWIIPLLHLTWIEFIVSYSGADVLVWRIHGSFTHMSDAWAGMVERLGWAEIINHSTYEGPLLHSQTSYRETHGSQRVFQGIWSGFWQSLSACAQHLTYRFCHIPFISVITRTKRSKRSKIRLKRSKINGLHFSKGRSDNLNHL